MSETGLDAVMLTGGTSLKYFTNVGWGLSERMFALVLPVKGRPFVVCPAFEEERAMEQLALGLEIGGTKLQAALGSYAGAILQRERGEVAAGATPEQTLAGFEGRRS
ncbi:MAG: aminopeptidase P family N-terminal domain-containing protein [Acidobacteria bacterium]|nr:aminopeptidase P family N-terminal domain-containing protein [Acidobacteriota bacterium]